MRNLNRMAIWLCLALCVAWLGGCSLLQPSDSKVISQAANTNQALSPAIITDPQVNGYFQSIGERIITAAKAEDADHVGPKTHFAKGEDNSWMFTNKIQFHLVNSKTLNAFTTGGEHVYIYNELFQQCRNEDELAAVMSHEFAHIYSRHVAQGEKHQLETLAAGALVGAGAGYALGGSDNGVSYAAKGASVGAAGGQFVNMGFTRKDEAQADQYGFLFYTHAGWDPKQFDAFFHHMIDLGYDKTPRIHERSPHIGQPGGCGQQTGPRLAAGRIAMAASADCRRFSIPPDSTARRRSGQKIPRRHEPQIQSEAFAGPAQKLHRPGRSG